MIAPAVQPTASTFPIAGVAAYWSLDEVSGTRFDSVGLAHLTAYNGPHGAPGKLGLGAELQQVDGQYLGTGDMAAIDTGNVDFTLTAWVHPATAGQMVVVGKDAISGRDYLLDIGPTQTARFSVSRNAGAAVVESVALVPVGAWSFLVAVHNAAANTIGIVVNDNPIVTTSTKGVPPNVSGSEFRIGSRAAAPIAEYFDGVVDEVGLWRRALTAPDVAALWNNGAGIPYPPPPEHLPIASAIRLRLLACPDVVALVSDRVTVLVSHQSPILPSIRIQEITRLDYPHLRGAADLRPSRIQVDVFARKGTGDAYTVAHAIANAVRGGFANGAPTGLVGFVGEIRDVTITAILAAGERELFDPDDLQTVRIVLEFFVFYKPAALRLNDTRDRDPWQT